MRAIMVVALAVILAAVTAPMAAQAAQAADTRLGLVIGVSDYGGPAMDLRNSDDDARRVGAALSRAGFTVEPAVLDPDKRSLQRAIQAFADKAQAASQSSDVTLFVYFSGHGVKIDEDQFLVPTKTALFDRGAKDKYDFEAEALPANFFLNKLLNAGAARVVIVFDACRSPPVNLARKSGPPVGLNALTRPAAASQSMIIYATESGLPALAEVDGQSLFARALERALGEKETFVDVYFSVEEEVRTVSKGRQRPTTDGSLNYQFATHAKPVSPLSGAGQSVAGKDVTASPVATFLGARENGEVDTLALTRDYVAQNGFDGLKQVAQTGDGPALYMLGLAYSEGFGTTKDPSAAADALTAAIAAGEYRAFSSLGYMNYKGEIGAKDVAQALRWWRQGAVRNIPGAINNLAFSYRDGEIGPDGKVILAKDPAEAARLFDQAAKLGKASAAQNLATMYRGSALGRPDPAKALRLYEEWSDRGDGFSTAELAGMYVSGEGVAADDIRANQYLQKAADQGNSWSASLLAERLDSGIGATKNPAAATGLYLRAAELGDPGAMVTIAQRYRDGVGVAASPKAAADWLVKAADTGSVGARGALGQAYIEGKLFPEDAVKGRKILAQVVKEEQAGADPDVWPLDYYSAGTNLLISALADRVDTVEGLQIEPLKARYSAKKGMKRFTVPAQCAPEGAVATNKTQIQVYIFDWGRPADMVGAQADYFSRRGCKIPADVTESFAKLFKIANENKVSFEELTLYALSAATKEQTASAAPR